MDNLERYDGPEFERPVLRCSNNSCGENIIIEPANTQLILWEDKPERDHTLSWCPGLSCTIKTLFWLHEYPSLDFLYEFQEVDVDRFEKYDGSYAELVESIWQRQYPEPEIHEITGSQEKKIAFLAYELGSMTAEQIMTEFESPMPERRLPIRWTE